MKVLRFAAAVLVVILDGLVLGFLTAMLVAITLVWVMGLEMPAFHYAALDGWLICYIGVRSIWARMTAPHAPERAA
jgi:hypothetical protein